MTIEMKELIAYPHFEGLGVFAYAREATDTRKAGFVFDTFGGQVTVEVEESEYQKPPAAGSVFHIVGTARKSNWNAGMTLTATGKRFVSDTFGVEHESVYTSGLRIKAVGKVDAKSSSVVNRKTFNKSTLKWAGAIHEFRSLSPEIFQRIPSVGSYARFEMSLHPSEVRDPNTGQTQIVHKPTLVDIRWDELVTGSKPSEATAAATAAVAGATPAKPAQPAQPAAKP